MLASVADRGERGRAVDPGNQLSEAVALIVLGPVGIARPVDQDEARAGLGTLVGERRQDSPA